MFKRNLIFLLSLIFILSFFFFFSSRIKNLSQEKKSPLPSPYSLEKKESLLPQKKIIKLKIGENIFQTEIANTEKERRQGLSGRENLCDKCAMLFIFEEKGKHSFWMKEMKFDLDIIWIRGEEVVFIAQEVSWREGLKTITSDQEADKVLEINSGFAKKLGIRVGDRVEFNF
jgi:uncharacterized protein